MSKSTNPVFRCGALLSAFALVGCASVADVKPGTSYGDVVKQFGEPAVTCPAPAGGKQAIWTQQPSGEYAWAIVVSESDQVTEVTQVLNSAFFDKMVPGEWDTSNVKCQFGPPAKVQIFPESPNDVTWEYRFVDPGDDFMMLYLTFDRATNRLIKFSTGMDPDYNPTMNR
jgi:hypothetical protein